MKKKRKISSKRNLSSLIILVLIMIGSIITVFAAQQIQEIRSRAHHEIGNSNVGGQFVTKCWYSHSDTGDPVVKPEETMRHMHEFFGNDVTSQNTTLAALQGDDMALARDPSKMQCSHSGQKSSYWVPRVTWGGQIMKPIRMGAYYTTRNGLDPKKTRTFPLGFKMVARSLEMPVPEGAKGIFHYHCGRKNSLPDSLEKGKHVTPTRCPAIEKDTLYDESEKINGWRGVSSLGVTVMFPECWDGNNFREPGGANMRHAVKKNGKMTCPENFPVQLPKLVILIDYVLPTEEGPLKVWDANEKETSWDNFHADYFNAHDQEKLTKICINEDKNTDFCSHRDKEDTVLPQ